MSLYKAIAVQLSSSGIKFETEVLKKTPLIEYMVLEAAGLLNLIQNKNLKTSYQDHCESTFEKRDGKPRSTITFNPINHLVLLNENFQITPDFLEQANLILHKYPQSERDCDSRSAYELIMLDEDILLAIKSSSIFIAAGDLSEFSLTDILLIKKKLELYQSGNDQIKPIVMSLDDKIQKHLVCTFRKDQIEEATITVNKQFTAHEIIKEQERLFNQVFAELEKKTEELLKKGAPYIKEKHNIKSFEFIRSFDNQPNPDYLLEYHAVANAAVKMTNSLTKARLSFFNYNTLFTTDSLQAFETSCKNAILEARTEFSKFRELPHAWLNDINPIFKEIFKIMKAVVGCFAMILYPLIEKYSKRGYYGTFFETKADALFPLDNFEAKVCDDVSSVIHQIGNALT